MYSSHFKNFFTEFDQDLDKLDIESYGISITTLEQVFLKIGTLSDPSTIFNQDTKLEVNNKNKNNFLTPSLDPELLSNKDAPDSDAPNPNSD